MYYKVLNEDLTPYHGGTGQWTLNQWMPPIQDLEPCRRGYHVCRKQDLSYWIGPAIHPVTIRGHRLEQDDKVVAREAFLHPKLNTWNERTTRLYAADCAEHVLHLFEKDHSDDRTRQAILATRAFAEGTIDRHTLQAACDAAWEAAQVAYFSAAYDAAYAAYAAAHAAYAAARAAAYAATHAAHAAYEAAYEAERAWQTERLFYYLTKGD